MISLWARFRTFRGALESTSLSPPSLGQAKNQSHIKSVSGPSASCRRLFLCGFSSCQPLITKAIGSWRALFTAAANGCHPPRHLITMTKGVYLQDCHRGANTSFSVILFTWRRPPGPPSFNIYIPTSLYSIWSRQFCQFGQVLDMQMLLALLLRFHLSHIKCFHSSDLPPPWMLKLFLVLHAKYPTFSGCLCVKPLRLRD